MPALVETNQAQVDKERKLQQYYLDMFDRILPAAYLYALKTPGPGYELFQAFAKMAERLSLAVAHGKVAGLTSTAAGGQKARAIVEFVRSVGSTVTVKQGTVVRASNGTRDFNLLADVLWNVPGAAVGVGVASAVAADGKTWSAAQALANTPSYYGLAFSDTLQRLVAVGNSVAMTSDDGGNTWMTRTIPAGTYHGVVWNGSIFVAVGTAFATSPDGVTWTVVAAPAGNYVSVAWAKELKRFVAVGPSNTAVSPDGATWTASSNSYASTSSVAWNGSVFAMVGGSQAAHSTDGVTWSAATIPAGTYAACAWGLAGSGKFVAVGVNSAAYSADGITWSAATIPAGTYNNNSAFWDGAVFAAVGSSVAAWSPDGITWTATAAPTGNFYAAAPSGTPGYGVVEAVATGYEWNVPGPRVTASGATLPGDIDTVWALVTDPLYGDPNVTVSQVTDATGGQDAVLDQIGADRNLQRNQGEPDASYALRIRSLPDTVSPGAIQRAANGSLSPYGVTFTLIEVWSITYQTCWNAPGATIAGSAYDPNLFCWNDPRTSPPFRGRWLGGRAGFVLTVTFFLGAQYAMAWNDTAANPAALESSTGRRAVGAWNVPSNLVASELQGCYDGYDVEQAATFKGLFDLLASIKAAGVPFSIELASQ